MEIVGSEVVEARNQQAENLGDQIGGSFRMQGGGFGIKGAMKGMAQAELFNLGMSAMGKYIANQTKFIPNSKGYEKIFQIIVENLENN